MKKKILSVSLVLLGIVLFFGARLAYVAIKNAYYTKPFVAKKVTVTLNPPKGAVTATITNITGMVKKQGRHDEKFQPITKDTTLLEGESVALELGSTTVQFDASVSADLTSYSQLDFVTALPNNMVVRQPNGQITYTVTGSIPPFSIRALGLLVQCSDSATVTVTTDAKGQSVQVSARRGKATLAYSDSNDDTQVVTLTQGQSAYYDYSASTLHIQ